MSFNRLDYDTGCYKQYIAESVGPLEYQIGTPKISCEPCMPKDPGFILQRSGASVDKEQSLIDVDSELLNITRPLSNNPVKKFLPKFTKDGEINNNPMNQKLHFKECNMPTREDTRLSNPPSTLRGTGWNRWEWLCQDPQERVEIPFDYNIQNKLVVRDNHRASLPRPVDQTLALPVPSEDVIKTNIAKVPDVPTSAPSVQWRSLDEVRRY